MDGIIPDMILGVPVVWKEDGCVPEEAIPRVILDDWQYYLVPIFNFIVDGGYTVIFHGPDGRRVTLEEISIALNKP